MRPLILTPLLLLLSSVLIGQNTQSSELQQTNIPDIDPRQYIKVFETRNSKKEKPPILLWDWKKRKGKDNFLKPNQNRDIVDVSSEIRIEFLKEEISRNSSFKGSISIEAEIAGGSDFRKVEVSPYSEIGVEKKRIGLTSRPTGELAGIFINLLIEGHKLRGSWEDIDPNTGYKEEIEFLKFSLDSYEATINRLDSILKVIELEPDTTAYDLSKDSLNLWEFTIFLDDSVTFKDIKDEIRTEKAQFEEGIKTIQEAIISTQETRAISKKDISKLNKDQWIQKLRLILDYIKYIQDAGEQAEDAFLSLIQLDHIKLKSIQNNLLNELENLNKSADQSNRQKIYSAIIFQLAELTDIEGSIIESGSSSGISGSLPSREIAALLSTDTNLKKRLAINASKLIFQELHYATIDLHKAGARPGEMLYVYVKLYDSVRREKDQKNGSVKVLEIGRYELKGTRWNTKVADSFFLVDRLNEEAANQNNLSPSSFKGAGGGSFLATWLNDGETAKHGLINTLQPSLGINVSYVDFSISDSFEVGVSGVLGLFNNRVFIGSGINLNLWGQDAKSPYFWSIGLSFANLGGEANKDK